MPASANVVFVTEVGTRLLDGHTDARHIGDAHERTDAHHPGEDKDGAKMLTLAKRSCCGESIEPSGRRIETVETARTHERPRNERDTMLLTFTRQPQKKSSVSDPICAERRVRSLPRHRVDLRVTRNPAAISSLGFRGLARVLQCTRFRQTTGGRMADGHANRSAGSGGMATTRRWWWTISPRIWRSRGALRVTCRLARARSSACSVPTGGEDDALQDRVTLVRRAGAASRSSATYLAHEAAHVRQHLGVVFSTPVSTRAEVWRILRTTAPLRSAGRRFARGRTNCSIARAERSARERVERLSGACSVASIGMALGASTGSPAQLDDLLGLDPRPRRDFVHYSAPAFRGGRLRPVTDDSARRGGAVRSPRHPSPGEAGRVGTPDALRRRSEAMSW